MQNSEMVVLVDQNDCEIGLMPKMEAHEKGSLHRAISVLIYNSKGEMLIQQRASTKYHWPLIWSNACCTHPRQNESYYDCAMRRTKEELGIEPALIELHRFIYRAVDPQTGLIEHEYDAVFTGIYNEDIHFDHHEVEAVRWISWLDLHREINENPDKFSFWFKEILNKIKKPIS